MTSKGANSSEELHVLVRYQLVAALAHATRASIVSLYDADGAMLLSTPAGEHTLGCPTPGLDAADAWSRMHPDDVGMVRDEMRRVFKQPGATTTVRYRLAEPDGSWRSFEADALNAVNDPTIQGILVTTSDITDGPSPTHTQRERTGRDPLTGLANHPSLLAYMAQALARAARHRWGTAVLVADLDRFSEINESFGHDAGDEVLVAVAARLTETFRASDAVGRAGQVFNAQIDAVARFGGDRFVVVCENVADEAAAAALGGRSLGALKKPVVLGNGEAIVVTAGIGVSIAGPLGPGAEQRIFDAESALRRAKHRGRSQCEVSSESTAARHKARSDAERALRQAVDQGELRLHYQPKVSFESNLITGAEALLRWEAPGRGLVPPLEFIPLAEETGLIIPIGTWVIEEACRQIADWHRSFGRQPPLVISVNVSARQFGPALVDVVAGALAAAGVTPGQLCLEVTESVLIGDPDSAVATLSGLAALGVKLSIDDFGTGYSSLSYLKRFPLHELKIDKSFVDGLGEDTNDTAIVAATVAMAHALGLSVTAEGVETQVQFEHLRVLGCQEAQGYLISRPQPAEAAARLLTHDTWPSWHLGALPAGGGTTERYRPERVLVIDDAADVRQLARMTLAAAGFEVSDLAHGAEALNVARRTLPDCVVVDVMMPDMSGFDVCRALRADPVTAGCTIVMLSANAAADDKIEAFSCGADDYVIKPFSPRDLTSRVRAAMRRGAGSTPAHVPDNRNSKEHLG